MDNNSDDYNRGEKATPSTPIQSEGEDDDDDDAGSKDHMSNTWIPEKPSRLAIKFAHYSSLQKALLRTNMPGNISTAAQTLLDAPPLALTLKNKALQQSLPRLGVYQLYNTIIVHAVSHKQFFQVLRLCHDMHSADMRMDFMAMYGILLAVSDAPTYEIHYQQQNTNMQEVVLDIVRHKLKHDEDEQTKMTTKGAKECTGLIIDLLQLRHNDELRRIYDAAVQSNDWAGVMRAILDVMEADDDADTTISNDR
eukprot:CAMPEP_0196816024 /NCGR_PEP_ID=MMETSP1362-20130617/53154_1 /TAXON_ID=163516 /ORGANISM="Leptocylindrus danicus, Strain CCMP1856" /LENGTH=251 /DNA_ID=CAMNT_0042193209 /DNA_START=89 /DNA_END=844 /DNA_ORIENTATION=-